MPIGPSCTRECRSTAIDERIYPTMGHTINREEIDAVKALLGNDRD
jgi:predicted esterase